MLEFFSCCQQSCFPFTYFSLFPSPPHSHFANGQKIIVACFFLVLFSPLIYAETSSRVRQIKRSIKNFRFVPFIRAQKMGGGGGEKAKPMKENIAHTTCVRACLPNFFINKKSLRKCEYRYQSSTVMTIFSVSMINPKHFFCVLLRIAACCDNCFECFAGARLI